MPLPQSNRSLTGAPEGDELIGGGYNRQDGVRYSINQLTANERQQYEALLGQSVLGAQAGRPQDFNTPRYSARTSPDQGQPVYGTNPDARFSARTSPEQGQPAPTGLESRFSVPGSSPETQRPGSPEAQRDPTRRQTPRGPEGVDRFSARTPNTGNNRYYFRPGESFFGATARHARNIGVIGGIGYLGYLASTGFSFGPIPEFLQFPLAVKAIEALGVGWNAFGTAVSQVAASPAIQGVTTWLSGAAAATVGALPAWTGGPALAGALASPAVAPILTGSLLGGGALQIIGRLNHWLKGVMGMERTERGFMGYFVEGIRAPYDLLRMGGRLILGHSESHTPNIVSRVGGWIGSAFNWTKDTISNLGTNTWKFLESTVFSQTGSRLIIGAGIGATVAAFLASGLAPAVAGASILGGAAFGGAALAAAGATQYLSRRAAGAGA